MATSRRNARPIRNTIPGRPVDWQVSGSDPDIEFLYRLHSENDAAHIGDINIPTSGFTTDDLLIWDGTEWVAIQKTALLALNDLTDVTISAPATGHGLRYNGTTWVNAFHDHGTDLLGLADDDHTQYIHNAPAASTRNVILPTGAFTALVVKAPSSGTANQFESQSNAGSATARFRVNSAGLPSCPGSGVISERFGASTLAAGTQGLAVGNAANNTGDAGTAVGGLTIAGTSGTGIGWSANASGTEVTAVGAESGGTASRGTCIGHLSAAGDHAVAVGKSATSNAVGAISVGAYAAAGAHQCVIGGLVAQGVWISELYLGSGVVDPSKVNVSISPTGGSGSNNAGASLALTGGKATGNAAAGDIIFQISDAGASGSTLQTLREKWRIVNNTGEWRSTLLTSVQDRKVGAIVPSWVVATDATRTGRWVFQASDSGGDRECLRLEASGTAPMVGFYGVAAVARPAAYTQTYATASRTMNAYTSDPESGAYTGIDNAQAGTVYATVADLNLLRVAYENLRVMAENRQDVLNQVIDDHQANGLLQ